MRTVFADTFYFLALVNKSGQAHGKAVAFSNTFQGRIVTTSWVLTEFADAMSSPYNRQAFHVFYSWLQTEPQIVIWPPEPILFNSGMALFAARSDKEWSLTDCISFVSMQQEQISEALTADHHFEQAGYLALLKQ